MGARMGIPLAHYKSESYRGVNIAKTWTIIGNAHTQFTNRKGIAHGRFTRRGDTNNIYNHDRAQCPVFVVIIRFCAIIYV